MTTLTALGSLLAVVSLVPAQNKTPEPLAPPEPILAIDNVRSEGPLARHSLGVSAGYGFASAPGAIDHAQLWSFQVVLGPRPTDGMLTDIASWLDRYALRLRLPMVIPERGRTLAGPMTFALDRYFNSGVLSIPALLNAQAGLEVAFATPWLSGREEMPPPVLAATNAVDTEFVRNGWSLRPVAAYLRGDFLACRKQSIEIGAGPEIFVPPQPGAKTEYDLRLHARVGMSLACQHSATSWLHHVSAAFEYSGRVRLYQSDVSSAYYQRFAFGLQWDIWWFTMGAFASTSHNPFTGWGYRTIGGWLQFNFL